MSNNKTKPSYESVFKFYNAIGSIFRSLNDCDNRDRVTANRYQDNSNVSELEERIVKSCLKPEAKKIKMPYTISTDDITVRMYLIDEEDFDVIPKDNIDTMKVPSVFSEFKDLVVILVNKEVFSMENLHDNIEDKETVLFLYKKIFDTVLIDQSWNYGANSLASVLAALFLYQVSGGNLSQEEYGAAFKYRHNCVVHRYDIMSKIFKINGISDTAHLNTGDQNIKNKIATTIDENLRWEILVYFSLDTDEE